MATNSTSSSSSGGIGFFGLLAIVFITLKLVGYIAWSWLWVLSPLWLPLAVLLTGLGVWLICYAAYLFIPLLWKR